DRWVTHRSGHIGTTSRMQLRGGGVTYVSGLKSLTMVTPTGEPQARTLNDLAGLTDAKRRSTHPHEPERLANLPTRPTLRCRWRWRRAIPWPASSHPPALGGTEGGRRMERRFGGGHVHGSGRAGGFGSPHIGARDR